MIINSQDLSETLSSFNVSVLPTKHFVDSLNKRMFPLNIVAMATVIAQGLSVGKTKEIYFNKRFKATVEIKKISENVAILLTGWKGVRNNNNRILNENNN